MNTIQWTQHPVGHGGFHTGQMENENGDIFTWIFDCGSRRNKEFDAYLRAWTNRQHSPVDWLFISHFDFDHVSGLETLMSRCIVREVMIPYVNDRELVYVLLEEIDRGNLNRSLVELIADPAGFFISRGASRITFLNGAGPEKRSEPENPDSPLDQDGQPGNLTNTPWKTKIDKPLQQLDLPTWAKQNHQVLSVDGGSCSITVGHKSIGLRLKPYRAPISKSNHQQMFTDVLALLGRKHHHQNLRPGLRRLAYDIALHARTNEGRKELKEIHKKYVGSSNRASLSLLSEPFNYSPNSAHCDVLISPFYYSSHIGAGWMNTGDAELLAASDLADWKACYSQHLKDIRVLALPHHGSDKNSDAQLQAICPNAILTAHVKSTSKHHPGSNVSKIARNRLNCVTENPLTTASMKFASN